MASVVIAHAAEDALPARALAQKLAAMGLTPVVEIPPGEALRTAMRDAAASLVLWSPRSVTSAELILDIARTPRVIHARMQNAPPPHEFSTERAIDLTGWRGEDDFPAWRDLAKIITDAAGLKPAAPPSQPRAPSGFFQPGAPPTPLRTPGPAAAPQRPIAKPAPPPAPQPAPQPSAQAAPQPAPRLEPQEPPRPAPQQATPPRAEPPRPMPAPSYAPPPQSPAYAPTARPEPVARARKRPGGGPNMAVIGIVTVAVLALAGGGLFYLSQQRADDGALEQIWREVDINDAGQLRAFIGSSDGPLRAQAVDALRALEETQFDAAMESDNIDAFQDFLRDFPESQYATRARGRIAELRELGPQSDTSEEAAEGEIDPETGLPIGTDPDLVPPGSIEGTETPESPDEPDSAGADQPEASEPSGPVVLTPIDPEPAPEPGPTN